MSGGTGTPGSLCATSLGIRPSLARALSPGTPLVRRALRSFHGKHPVTRPLERPGDDVILEVRRLHEQAGLPTRQILAHLAGLGYDKTLSWVYQTSQYHNRGHLVPSLGAAPYLTESLPCPALP